MCYALFHSMLEAVALHGRKNMNVYHTCTQQPVRNQSSIEQHAFAAASSCSTSNDLYQASCAQAESTWPAVHMVNGHGYGSHVYELLRCLDAKIW